MGTYSHNADSISTKGQYILPIKAYLTEKLRRNQTIMRSCCYLTKSPLASKSFNNDGVLYYQKDLDWQTVNITKKVNINIGKEGTKNIITIPPSIIPYTYNDDMVTDEQVFIFIHNNTNRFNNLIGDNIFSIDILVPYNYDMLDSPLYGQRLYLIVEAIMQEIDDTDVDRSIGIDLPDLHFEVKGNSEERKISKSNSVLIYSIDVTVKTINTRTGVDNYGYL